MGVEAALFTSAGQTTQHYIPGVYSRRNTVGAGTGVSSGNLVILGQSQGGKPKTLLCVSDVSEAKDLLVSGDLLEGVTQAFTGSSTFIPQKVYCVRVNEGTQSKLELKNNDNNKIVLTSTEYGARSNLIKLSFSDMQNAQEGKTVTLSYNGKDTTAQNIIKPSFDIKALQNIEKCEICFDATTTSEDEVMEKALEAGADDVIKENDIITVTTTPEVFATVFQALKTNNFVPVSCIAPMSSATCTIDNEKISLLTQDANGETKSTQISLVECDTLQSLIEKINDTGLFAATLIDTTIGAKTCDLDCVTSVDILQTKTMYSNVCQLVKTLKALPYIADVEVIGEKAMPQDTQGFVYFQGGKTQGATSLDLIEVLQMLESEDIQIIATTLPCDLSLTLIDAHCKQMSAVEKRKERTYWVGLKENITIEEAKEIARQCNTELGSLVMTGAVATNAITGKSQNISPALLACKMAGIESACSVSTPLTNKNVNVSAFDHKYKTNELNALIQSGIVPFGENEEGSLVCIRAITCYQENSLILNERSMIRSVLYMDRDLRKAYSRRTGTNGEPSESEILQVLYNKAKGWYTEGLITKSDDGKFVFNEKVKFAGDKAYVSFDRYIRAPNNFTFITATNRVYSSTVEI